ncbi:MAG: histidinol phosphatase [Nitriliruptorales bacterium]|nr:histidinol phosphatase [Nitriliruptorales bacterium]
MSSQERIRDVDLQAARDAALAIAEEADEISLRHFRGGVEPVAKADGSPVTVADRDVEALVRRRLAEQFPDHALLGEEQGGRLDSSQPTWVIDPIDATKNFMRGIPVYATLISLVVDGEPMVGVASAPAMGERWDAARRLGTRRNGKPVQVSGITELGDAHVLHGGLDWFRKRPQDWALLGELADRAWRTRGFGDFWMHLLVAGGMADVAVERDLRPWDIAAVACIVTEAGGRLTGWDGGSALATGQALSTNAHLHAEMLTLLSKTSADLG